MVGIEHSKKVLVDIGKMSLDVIQIVKHFSVWTVISKMGDILVEGKALIEEAKSSLPELQDLNEEEVKELTSQAYIMVKKIIEEIGKA